jgi:hypothetical protein
VTKVSRRTSTRRGRRNPENILQPNLVFRVMPLGMILFRTSPGTSGRASTYRNPIVIVHRFNFSSSTLIAIFGAPPHERRRDEQSQPFVLHKRQPFLAIDCRV